MFKKYFIAAVVITLLLFCFASPAEAQVTISGPTCGVAGSTSNYTAQRPGGFVGVTNMRWCVNGGTIIQVFGQNVTNDGGCKVGTNAIQITVQWNSVASGSVSLTTPVGNPPGNINVTIATALVAGTISNTNQTIAYNATPATINCSVATNGYCSPSYSYQWQSSPDNSTWSDVSGATSQNLSFSTGLIQTTFYRRRVTENNSGATVYSNTATVNVNQPFSSPAISPATQDVWLGDAATVITLSTPPTGGSCGGSYGYAWQTSTDGVNFSDNGTGGSGPFSPGTITSTKWYRLRVTCGIETAFSNAAVVNVYPHLATPAISPSSTTITYNTAPPILIGGTPTGGKCSPFYSYQWQSSTDNITFTNIPGATGSSLAYSQLTTTTYFKRIVTCSPETVSATATVTVNPQLFVGSIAPGNIVIPSGVAPGTLTSMAASGGACSGSYTYQWQSSTDNVTFTNISGANALMYNPPALTATTYYRMRVICGTDTHYSRSIVVTVQSAGAYLYNFIKVRDITKPAVTTESAAGLLTALREVKQATQYFDGLGRPWQTVIKQGALETDPLNPTSSAAAVDMVNTVVYDAFNREEFKYLSFASTATDATKNDGNFKLNPYPQQSAFNTTQFGAQGETYFFGRTLFETSPLDMVNKKLPAGNNWISADRGITLYDWSNTSTDDVKKWSVTDVAGNWGTYSMSGVYSANELLKKITVDEHGKQVVEFKDKEGKLILRKVQITATADNGTGSGYTGWLCTYNVYDNLGNLRLIVQPRGVELLVANSWNITALSNAILNEQCFRYEYDGRNRMIRKKAPGGGEVYMVYDARDRLVMTQDANLRTANKWLITLYDGQNRSVQTGLLLNTWNNNTFAQHLTSAYGSTTYPFTEASVPSTTYWEFLTKTGYDDYSTIPGASGLTSTLDNTYTSATYMYTTYNTSPAFAEQVTASSRVTGLETWTQTKVLGTASTYIYSVTIYDNKGRVIQVKTKNQLSGTDIVTTQYNFIGKPLVVVTRSEKTGINAQVHIITTKMEYDDLDRLLATKKTVSSSGAVTATKAELEIVRNEYNKLGQDKTKLVGKKKDAGGTYTSTPVETLSYDYNIRGWLLGMNRSQVLTTNGQSTRYFGFELGYDKTSNSSGRNFTAVQYNGDISGIIWKSYGDGIRRKYDFNYDAAGRLMQGLFEQNDAGSTWGNTLVNYNIKMGDGTTVSTAYDANGNIKQLQQWGLKVTGSSQLDNLTYTYIPNSNRLQNVIDANNDTQTKLGDFRSSSLYMTALGGAKTSGATDYVYDANGNLIKDRNKDIGDGSNNGITYNQLNLPEVITIRTTAGAVKGTITYTYDARGNKLQKVVTETSQPTKTTLYLGGAVYENDVLQFLPQEEGRIRYSPAVGATAAKYDYDYFIKDHLGNVRMVLTDEQQQDVYPAATLEGSISTPGSPNAIYTEKDYYNINAANVVDKSMATGITDYQNNNGNPPYNNNPNSNTTANSQKLYKLIATAGANGGVTGLGITMKVMGGDKIDIFGKSYYFQDNTGGSNYNVPVSGILDGLLGTPGSPASGKTSSGELNGLSVITTAISSFLTDANRNTGGTSTTPKAYINYILLDEQFRYVSGSFSRVGPANAVKNHYSDAAMQNINVTKNGYIYVYVSNESPSNVFFDNLQVIHTRGPILEETHYYPYGLTMTGISSKAVGKTENKKNKFQNQEFTNDLDISMYEFKYRMDDNQTGRFWQIDPLSDKYVYNSTYAFSENKVTRHIELEGLEATLPDDCRYCNFNPQNENNEVPETKKRTPSPAQPPKNLKEKPAQPKIGKTVTNLKTVSEGKSTGVLGEYAYRLGAGPQTGQKGSIATIDVTIRDGVKDRVAITFHNPIGGPDVTIGRSADGTVQVGFKIGGTEVRYGKDDPISLTAKHTLTTTHTTPNGIKASGSISAKPSETLMGTIIGVAVVLTMPQAIPALIPAL